MNSVVNVVYHIEKRGVDALFGGIITAFLLRMIKKTSAAAGIGTPAEGNRAAGGFYCAQQSARRHGQYGSFAAEEIG